MGHHLPDNARRSAVQAVIDDFRAEAPRRVPRDVSSTARVAAILALGAAVIAAWRLLRG
jgi:hypothetical protein